MSDASNELQEPTKKSSEEILPVEQQSLIGEFFSFIRYNKAWWMTPIIIVLILMVAFILFAESSPVLPFIYTVI